MDQVVWWVLLAVAFVEVALHFVSVEVVAAVAVVHKSGLESPVKHLFVVD